MIPHVTGRPVTRKRWVHGVGTADAPRRSFFEKNLEPRARLGAPGAIRTRRARRTTRWSATRHARVARPGREPRAARAAVAVRRRRRAGQSPTGWSSTSTRARGWGSPSAPRSRGWARDILHGHGARAVPGHERQQGHPPLRGTATGARRATRSPRSRTSSPARSRPTTPSSSSRSMRRPSARGRVLIDWSQNNGAKTTIAPYSLRGRARPTVAAPAHVGGARRPRPRGTSRSTRCSSASRPSATTDARARLPRRRSRRGRRPARRRYISKRTAGARPSPCRRSRSGRSDADERPALRDPGAPRAPRCTGTSGSSATACW